MKSKRLTRITFALLLVLTNISCDQVTKSIVRQEINPHERIRVLSDYLILTKVENAGAFLSLGSAWSTPAKAAILILLPLLALGYGLYILLTKVTLTPLFMIGLAFMLGGGIGNLFDRIMFGSVTDFLHIHTGLFQTGIFNMADVSIMVGMGFILLDVLVLKNRLERNLYSRVRNPNDFENHE